VEIENFEPTVTLIPMRKAIRKAMTKQNITLTKSIALEKQMRSAAGEVKAKAKQEDTEQQFDSTCMICSIKFEVGLALRCVMYMCVHCLFMQLPLLSLGAHHVLCICMVVLCVLACLMYRRLVTNTESCRAADTDSTADRVSTNG
jgi:hypothetical protein